jgi:hypothetical protein
METYQGSPQPSCLGTQRLALGPCCRRAPTERDESYNALSVRLLIGHVMPVSFPRHRGCSLAYMVVKCEENARGALPSILCTNARPYGPGCFICCEGETDGIPRDYDCHAASMPDTPCRGDLRSPAPADDLSPLRKYNPTWLCKRALGKQKLPATMAGRLVETDED